MAYMLQALELDQWEQFKITRTPGQTKHWRLKTVTIGENSSERWKNIADGRDTGFGTFTILQFRDDLEKYADTYTVEDYGYRMPQPEWHTMMSDTQAEIYEHYEFIDRVANWQWFEDEPCEVVIGGLGLGMVAEACAQLGANVTVLEYDPEVIELIGAQVASDKIRVIHADVFTWTPDRKFDLAWWDIWPTISSDNLAEMRQLKRRYRKHVGWWQGCWAWNQCLYARRSLRTDPYDLVRSARRQARLLGENEQAQAELNRAQEQARMLGEVNVLQSQGKHAEAEARLAELLAEFEVRNAEAARRAELHQRLAIIRETHQTTQKQVSA